MRRRYEREIEELLEQMDDFLPEKSPLGRRQTQFTLWLGYFGQVILSWCRRVSSQQLMLISFLLIAVAFFLRLVAPPVAYFVVILGAFLLVFAFALSFLKGKNSAERRWRGKVVELPQGRTQLGKWLSRWVRRRTR